MAEVKKQERDFTVDVDALLPEASSLVKSGSLQTALDKLFALEKQTRNASDLKSTTRLARTIIDYSYESHDCDLLNLNIKTLEKKHGQLKAVIQSIVEQTMNWLDPIKTGEGSERWLQLIETLRLVTEGKIFLETPRARVTLLLSLHNESLAKSAAVAAEFLRHLQTASNLLSELQVETYSSMERREKTEYLIEQMRLLILVAQTKDSQAGKESLSDGEPEWVKARVGGRKVNEAFLKEPGNEDLKLKYYELMIQYALHESAYLNVAKYYYKIWETPSIKEDEDGKGREALELIVYYIILAPHENEQSDMLHRLSQDPALAKLERHFNLVKCFTTQELMRWTGIEGIYSETLRATAVFGPTEGEKRYQDLHTRVTEHNLRVVARYYTRISITRLMSLLDLTREQAEETLSRLVVNKMVWARIDRPTGVVSFRSERNAEDIMNDWSFDMQRLLGLVEKSWMGMNAAQAAQGQAGRVKA